MATLVAFPRWFCGAAQLGYPSNGRVKVVNCKEQLGMGASTTPAKTTVGESVSLCMPP